MQKTESGIVGNDASAASSDNKWWRNIRAGKAEFLAGRWDHALARFEQSLAIAERHLCEDQSDIVSLMAKVTSLHNCAAVRRRLGDLRGAEADYRHACDFLSAAAANCGSCRSLWQQLVCLRHLALTELKTFLQDCSPVTASSGHGWDIGVCLHPFVSRDDH